MTAEEIKFLKFQNPSKGQILFGDVLSEIIGFMQDQPRDKYTLMIGSDSIGRGSIDLVSVIAVHRIGNGGRYFWYRQNVKKIKTLRQKIYSEVQASLELAGLFLPAFRGKLASLENLPQFPFDFQIHVDVGMNGETKSLVKEVTGMVTGYGYDILVKPESAAATNFADRHVR